MKTFPPARIRNVALVGHGGTGKTTLAEALLSHTGAINRKGRVEDGTTTTDFDPEEIKRGISVSLALAPFEFQGHKGLQAPSKSKGCNSHSATRPFAHLTPLVPFGCGRP